MMPIPANAKGAWCTIQYYDEEQTLERVFFSFGEYNYEKDKTHDSFGFLDELVFYYTTPEELPLLMTEGACDFRVEEVEEYEVGA